MPLGATPSRWCVCQFHHFRTLKLPCFQLLNQCILEGPINRIGSCTDPLRLDPTSWLYRDSRPPGGQAIFESHSPESERSTPLSLYSIVPGHVLQSKGIQVFLASLRKSCRNPCRQQAPINQPLHERITGTPPPQSRVAHHDSVSSSIRVPHQRSKPVRFAPG